MEDRSGTRGGRFLSADCLTRGRKARAVLNTCRRIGIQTTNRARGRTFQAALSPTRRQVVEEAGLDPQSQGREEADTCGSASPAFDESGRGGCPKKPWSGRWEIDGHSVGNRSGTVFWLPGQQVLSTAHARTQGSRQNWAAAADKTRFHARPDLKILVREAVKGLQRPTRITSAHPPKAFRSMSSVPPSLGARRNPGCSFSEAAGRLKNRAAGVAPVAHPVC